MAMSDPFSDVLPVSVGASVPGGVCDGLLITVSGNVGYTTMKGSIVAPYAVTAGMIVPVRCKAIHNSTTATVLAGYHT